MPRLALDIARGAGPEPNRLTQVLWPSQVFWKAQGSRHTVALRHHILRWCSETTANRPSH